LEDISLDSMLDLEIFQEEELELSNLILKVTSKTESCNLMKIMDWLILKRKKIKIFQNLEVKELFYWQMEKIIWLNNHLCNT